MSRAVVIALAAVLLSASAASAQSFNSHWGIQASFAPSWTVPDSARVIFDADTLSVEGSEFRVGVVRGRTLGGDWGLSFVQKSLDDGSFTDGEAVTRTARDVIVRGVAIDKFGVFGTIKERVQIGMIFGVGVGTASGSVTEFNKELDVSEEVEGKRFFSFMGEELPVVPLGRLELAVAAIVMPGLKVRASGGINYPGVATFTVGGVYLFGER